MLPKVSRWSMRNVVILFAALWLQAGSPALAGGICARAAAEAEAAVGVPAQLLSAIAVAESGRYHAEGGETIAWPWTVYALGKGRYLPSKAAAIAEVQRLRAAGVRNIDVGCMQVNLRYHPQAFASLEEAFDPARNARYASRYLARLYSDSRSWSLAVAGYHSKTDRLGRPYRARVFRLWEDERRRVARAVREERIALYVKRRAERPSMANPG